MPDMPHACEQMRYSISESTLPLTYNDQLREYSLSYIAPVVAGMTIEHCPYCGAQLPKSLREEWFERVWAMDLEPDDPRVPADLRTGKWWRDAGL